VLGERWRSCSKLSCLACRAERHSIYTWVQSARAFRGSKHLHGVDGRGLLPDSSGSRCFWRLLHPEGCDILMLSFPLSLSPRVHREGPAMVTRRLGWLRRCFHHWYIQYDEPYPGGNPCVINVLLRVLFKDEVRTWSTPTRQHDQLNIIEDTDVCTYSLNCRTCDTI
jgi:hypothetical protein